VPKCDTLGGRGGEFHQQDDEAEKKGPRRTGQRRGENWGILKTEGRLEREVGPQRGAGAPSHAKAHRPGGSQQSPAAQGKAGQQSRQNTSGATGRPEKPHHQDRTEERRSRLEKIAHGYPTITSGGGRVNSKGAQTKRDEVQRKIVREGRHYQHAIKGE